MDGRAGGEHEMTGNTRTRAAVTAGALALTFAVASPARAQYGDDRTAVDRCEQELTYRLGRESQAREPQNQLDYRGLDVRQQGRNWVVRGGGRFMRDRFDRGREFT